MQACLACILAQFEIANRCHILSRRSRDDPSDRIRFAGSQTRRISGTSDRGFHRGCVLTRHASVTLATTLPLASPREMYCRGDIRLATRPPDGTAEVEIEYGEKTAGRKSRLTRDSPRSCETAKMRDGNTAEPHDLCSYPTQNNSRERSRVSTLDAGEEAAVCSFRNV